MLSLVVVFVVALTEAPRTYQEAAREFTLAKGWYWASQVKQGMTSQEVLAVLGVPKYGGALPSFSCVLVGSKGQWVYPDYGVRVNWFTATEMWWALPSSSALSGCPATCPYT